MSETNIKEVDIDVLVKLIQSLGLLREKEEIKDMVLYDVASGFKLNDNGTFNLVEYGAWLTMNRVKNG